MCLDVGLLWPSLWHIYKVKSKLGRSFGLSFTRSLPTYESQIICSTGWDKGM